MRSLGVGVVRLEVKKENAWALEEGIAQKKTDVMTSHMN